MERPACNVSREDDGQGRRGGGSAEGPRYRTDWAHVKYCAHSISERSIATQLSTRTGMESEPLFAGTGTARDTARRLAFAHAPGLAWGTPSGSLSAHGDMAVGRGAIRWMPPCGLSAERTTEKWNDCCRLANPRFPATSANERRLYAVNTSLSQAEWSPPGSLVPIGLIGKILRFPRGCGPSWCCGSGGVSCQQFSRAHHPRLVEIHMCDMDCDYGGRVGGRWGAAELSGRQRLDNRQEALRWRYAVDRGMRNRRPDGHNQVVCGMGEVARETLPGACCTTATTVPQPLTLAGCPSFPFPSRAVGARREMVGNNVFFPQLGLPVLISSAV